MWSNAPQPMALPALLLSADGGAPRRSYGVREQHRNSWGVKVSAYLWTKSLAAGAFLTPALASMLDGAGSPLRPGAALVALLFLALTGAFLISDLRQPRRFLWTLTRPQWRSWLVRGAYIIAAYGACLGAHVLDGVGWLPFVLPRAITSLTVLLAAGTAVYTAFLFGQAKGRDLWQSSLLGPHLLVQALAAGAALFEPRWLLFLLPVSGLLVAGEVWGQHPTEDARLAARLIRDDARFTTNVLVLGHLLPLSLLWASLEMDLLTGGLTLLGLLSWEHLFVQAPQRIPLA
jgi:hypothetical protein